MSLPFDGAISAFAETDAPADVRSALSEARKKDIVTPDYPYDRWMGKKAYEEQLDALQIELVKCQAWMRETGHRLVAVFEGRDAAGKGGTIRRVTQHLSPRAARVVALSKPTETEAGEWYFQRYIRRLPTTGEMVIFDRSWYNRAVVEKVFGFCTDEERATFFEQLPDFERMLVKDGIILLKFWLTVGQAEQLRRFLSRERDPLKQWKLSSIDVKGLSRWDDYTRAIDETLDRAHFDFAPWTVVRSDDKRRARLNAIRVILNALPYDGRRDDLLEIDPKVAGGPELWLDGA
ncbi:polyphosphate kinase 2 [Jannaschia aquimarina]|uniref:ADP/GDP-polyphosphate phosphotransferase n=1 Tax=Jannaschia aquimarina TaxID=935700 RepID=A0A0D1EE12_9RHOB|nr:polyphosphate kinase 2 [Jannaschia aquimarina]KIT15924.1 Polyphosphate kinase 2 (PPK2) [Jannaschia aquimarina]SNS97924.1 polyphosphate kinase 2, PA0141 family [Jannaschia aquimarina]